MIIHGIHPVTEALRSQYSPVERIWVASGKSNPRLRRIVELAKSRGVPLEFKSAATMSLGSGDLRQQEVMAEISSFHYSSFEVILKTGSKLLLLVDGIEDPHNLGALLRSAEGAGVGGIFMPKKRSCTVTPAVVKASAGAAMHLRISRVANVVRTLQSLKQEGFWVLGLDMRGENSLDELDIELPWVVVVGGEHRGVRRLLREQCDFMVSLPMRGRVSSLNLSVAAGVLLYQLVLRQKEEPG